MGECPERPAASSRGYKVSSYSCEAHHVGSSAEKDCGRSKSEMGETEGGTEEGGIETAGAYLRDMRQALALPAVFWGTLHPYIIFKAESQCALPRGKMKNNFSLRIGSGRAHRKVYPDLSFRAGFLFKLSPFDGRNLF
jgi:hypothetical protein